MPGATLGAPLTRREDPRLLVGRGRFVDDEPGDGGLHAAFVRSTLAHARLLDIDLGAARSIHGVVGAYTAADLRLPPRLAFPVLPDAFARPPLATDTVRFVGEAVAVVVAGTAAAAEDAAEAVTVDYERLPPVLTPEQAAAPEAPLLFPEHGSNLAFEVELGSEGDPLAGAEVAVRGRFGNQRLVAVPIEPNAMLAAPDAETGGLLLRVSTQSPFQVRDFVADSLGMQESLVRCVAADVGGGFGAKLAVYPEQAVVAELARRLDRPVRWIESRSESFLAMYQGRGQVQEVELGATRDGRLVGLRAEVVADAGAYPGQGAFLPFYTGQMLPGPYRLPAVSYRARSYATNRTPTAAYRGAGRPEATALLERAMDLLAAELGTDPAELRRRNLIAEDEFPYETVTGSTYDSGAYSPALELALQAAGYRELRQEQRRRREAGGRRVLGIGISSYVEITALGSPTEYASVEARTDGSMLILAGTASHGQGHETAFAQIAADVFGRPPAAFEVVEADTGRVPRGDGTSASRSIQLGGSAVLEAARALLERGRRLAAELLEADPDDLVTTESGFSVRGTPGASLGWSDLAVAERRRGGSALKEESDLFAEPSYPFGAHVAVAEVDLETGEARLVRHLAVDDCGTIVNPRLVEGQVHGGVAQGAGQALFEEVVLGPDGSPLTGSLLDYGVATANELPPIETIHTVTPSPNNPLGAKGIGESGTIGATPAVQNAVIDALAHLGIRHLDMPLTPERIWRALGKLSPDG